MLKLALGVKVSVSLLFAELGSEVPGGGITLAVLISNPVASGATVPVTVNTTVSFGSTVTRALILPVPLAGVGHKELLPVVVQLQVTPVSWSGRLSVTVAFVAVLGPAFVTVMV